MRIIVTALDNRDGICCRKLFEFSYLWEKGTVNSIALWKGGSNCTFYRLISFTPFPIFLQFRIFSWSLYMLQFFNHYNGCICRSLEDQVGLAKNLQSKQYEEKLMWLLSQEIRFRCGDYSPCHFHNFSSNYIFNFDDCLCQLLRKTITTEV